MVPRFHRHGDSVCRDLQPKDGREEGGRCLVPDGGDEAAGNAPPRLIRRDRTGETEISVGRKDRGVQKIDPTLGCSRRERVLTLRQKPQRSVSISQAVAQPDHFRGCT